MKSISPLITSLKKHNYIGLCFVNTKIDKIQYGTFIHVNYVFNISKIDSCRKIKD